MTKTSTFRSALGALALGVGLVGCVDFTGPGINTNPNVPIAATAGQLFPAVQAFQQSLINGDANRFVGIWDQQLMGINRQFSSIARYSLYDENTYFWDSFYVGGGLHDLRLIQKASFANDKLFLGIAQAYEAMIMDVVADMFGNIPYKLAGKLQVDDIVNIPTPKLERQDSVYLDLQILLDSAITNLTAGTGAGPARKDLVYAGSATKWIAAAHTLKARIALHQRLYALAASEAALGISLATKANDYNSYQSAGTGEENNWFQFRRNRGTDISAGDTLVVLMQSRTDPRLTQYFELSPSGSGVVKGAKPGDEDDGTQSWLSVTRGAPEFRQPLITYDETQLIKAEALSLTGSDAAALAALQAYKTANGITFNFAAPSAGAALRNEIMVEKYIAMFQHMETWSDYKRTCTPNLRANPTAVAPQTKIPLRFIYSASERQTNPNVPSPSAVGVRNFVEGAAAPTPYSGGACTAQP